MPPPVGWGYPLWGRPPPVVPGTALSTVLTAGMATKREQGWATSASGHPMSAQGLPPWGIKEAGTDAGLFNPLPTNLQVRNQEPRGCPRSHGISKDAGKGWRWEHLVGPKQTCTWRGLPWPLPGTGAGEGFGRTASLWRKLKSGPLQLEGQ